jgi:penicillin G amidase
MNAPSPARPRRRALRVFFIGLAALCLLGLVLAAVAGLWLRASLPTLQGELPLAGLGAPVSVLRDARGVPVVIAADRADLSRALGFLHAQERYFQMDLLRRRAAGELSALLGARTLDVDRAARLHGLREQAKAVVAALPPHQRSALEAYVAGINQGLEALAARPWEYLLLQATPAAWQPEDTVLCMYAMWFDLQDESGDYERSLQALYETAGEEGLDFVAGLGMPDDAALDGSQLPLAAVPAAAPAAAATQLAHATRPAAVTPGLEPAFQAGSNSFAVAGRHTTHGAALLANDMHLALRVPNVWYQAELRWHDAAGQAHRAAGATLPGAPALVVGSNGRVAWGFTNSNVDTVDVRLALPGQIRELRRERIEVRGEAPVELVVRGTDWGPVVTAPDAPRQYALRWNVHSPEAANLGLMDLESAGSAEEALAIGQRAGMPNQNLLVADRDGHVGWTVTGAVPVRAGTDGRLPRNADAEAARWTGWLAPENKPVIRDPADGLLWTANNRIVGGEALRLLGDSGYDSAIRARSIREDLRAAAARGPVDEAALLGVQLGDRAPHLKRWQALLLQVLAQPALAGDPRVAALREEVSAWQDRAAPASAGYRLIRAFRAQVAERALARYIAAARSIEPEADFGRFRVEAAVWTLVSQRPAAQLPAEYADWDALLQSAVRAVLDQAGDTPEAVRAWTWGARNTLRMEHPFAGALPGWLASHLNMVAEPLPGDAEMARYQSPGGGASERMVVAPGHEVNGIFHMPGGQAGHPLSPYFRASHDDWVLGRPAPLLSGTPVWQLTLQP